MTAQLLQISPVVTWEINALKSAQIQVFKRGKTVLSKTVECCWYPAHGKRESEALAYASRLSESQQLESGHGCGWAGAWHLIVTAAERQRHLNVQARQVCYSKVRALAGKT